MDTKALEQIIFICKEFKGIRIKHLSAGVSSGVGAIEESELAVSTDFFDLGDYKLSTDDIGIFLSKRGFEEMRFFPYSAILEITPQEGKGFKKI